MNRLSLLAVSAAVTGVLAFGACAQQGSSTPAAQKSTTTKSTAPAKKDSTAAKPAATTTAPATKGGDTLVIIGRVLEIPGKFPSNDLYNYVYVMKYRVVKVVKGAYEGKEILVGHYNPLIPRAQIKDKMAKSVSGDIQKFEVGAKHKMTLITPISKVWGEAIEDEYIDSDLTKYYAVKADMSTEQ
jgi:hypothetical protein